MIVLRRSSADWKLPIAARRLARLGSALAAVLLVVGSANDLRASCGDYVATDAGRVMATGHLHFHSLRTDDLPLIPTTGCRGPDCQRHLPGPTDPSRDVVTVRPGERAFWAADFQAPSVAPSGFPLDDAQRPLDGYHRPIEHPPRLGG